MSELPSDPELTGFLAVLAAQRAPRTVDAYRRDLEHFARSLGSAPSRATTEELERYVAQLRADGLSAATIARRLSALKGLYRHLMLLGARVDNPAAELSPPRRVRRLPRTLSPSEAERLIVRGFFSDVLDRIELEPVRKALGAALEARIPQA